MGSSGVWIDFTHEQGFTPTSLSQVLKVCDFEDVELYGEAPVVHDFRSFARSCLWKVTKVLLRAYLVVEGGTGRDMWRKQTILERRMFALARKPL